MNLIKDSHYSFSNTFVGNKSFLVLSDIHFSRFVLDRTYKLFKKICNYSFDYLIIPGDLIDYYEVLKCKKVRECIINCFSLITSQNKKIFYVLGNHEFYNTSKKRRFVPDVYDTLFFKSLRNMENVYVLNNEKYSDYYVEIVGISLPLEYYHDKNYDENKEYLVDTFKRLETTIFSLKKSHKIKILLVHSPKYITDLCFKKYVDIFDTVFCGHFHNGSVPILLDDIWKSNKGLIGAYLNKFPRNARGIIDNKIVVCGAVNFIQPSKLNYKFINFFYPIHICTIDYVVGDKNVLNKSKYYKL